MANETQVTIYYGPLSWFHAKLGHQKQESLLEIVFERDEASRHHTIRLLDQDDTSSDDGKNRIRPKRVVAESSDYASLNEHVITNFAGLVRSIRPKHLHLHNPPAQVQAQIERAFPVAVERYEYPSVTRETLMKVRDNFADHLVGQAGVRERLLAALYPLTRPGRMKPMVLMFYGPSGVGKTETAQFVNSLLGGTLLRRQFSMFHSDKFASYLFGGTHFESSLAHDLLDRESGVILIDEFDKANSVFHSAFYQLFDSGVFEDKNYTVELGPSLIICTSNYDSENEIQKALGEALYSRFDFVIRFEELSGEEVVQIIDRLVEDRFARLAPEEREQLKKEDIKKILYPLAKQSSNVRKLGKMVDELMSIMLVRSLIGEGSGASARA